MYYNPKYMNILCMCHIRIAWARVALPRGPECHVASMCVPRKINPFFAFLKLIFNLKIENKFIKIQKNPKKLENS